MEIIGQSLLVARFDLGTALRTPRAIVAVALYALGACVTAMILVAIEQEVASKIQMARAVATTAAHAKGIEDPQVIEEALTFLMGGDREMAKHLMGIPLVVAGFFWLTLTFLPYLVALVSHDIVNAEVRNRSARFVLLRCPREALLLGKLASHGAVFLAVTVVSNLVLAGYAWAKVPGFDVAGAGLWLVRFWAFTAVYGFCWLALTALISTLIDSGIVSLVVLFVAIIALGIVSFSDSFGFVSPAYWKGGLWSPRWGEVAGSLAVFVGFGLAFLGLAWLRLKKRDM